ncbi:MAG: Hint domain-containing protein [Tateyamaria sp.]|uniref:Hint domain-containing protein n=1 Tax=Tateyamaria sp. TaxID=1929288 RepID=UPI00328512CB
MAIYTDQTIAGNYDPGASSTPFTATIITMEINDADNDNVIRADGGDQVNGSNVTAVWVGDTIVLNGETISGVTFYTADGGRYFTPDDDTVLEDGTITAQTFVTGSTQFPVGDFGPPCFVVGTRIRVPGGQVPVEKIGVGDLVETRDHGAQRVCWIGSRTVTGQGAFAPVHIQRGALGNADPLTVSPQHRIMIDDWRAAFYLGDDEVLCSAQMLVNGETITREACPTVKYVHFMFDRHEIVYANGVAAESFLPGEYLCHENSSLRTEIDVVFPEQSAVKLQMAAARRIVRSFEAHLILPTIDQSMIRAA